MLDILLQDDYFTQDGSADETPTTREMEGAWPHSRKRNWPGFLPATWVWTRGQALKSVDALFNGLGDALRQGGRIEIRGFGAWTVKATNSKHNARNPRTGEVVFIPARRKVAFKAGRIIKDALSRPIEVAARP